MGGRGGCSALQESPGLGKGLDVGTGEKGAPGITPSLRVCTPVRQVLFAEVAEKGRRGLGQKEAWSSSGGAGFRRPWAPPNRDPEEATLDGGLGTRRTEDRNVSLANRWELRPCSRSRQTAAQDSLRNPVGRGARQGGRQSRRTGQRRPEPRPPPGERGKRRERLRGGALERPWPRPQSEIGRVG